MMLYDLSGRDWRRVPLTEAEAAQVLSTVGAHALSTLFRLNRRAERVAVWDRADGRCELCQTELRDPTVSATDDDRPTMTLDHRTPLAAMTAAELAAYTANPLAFVSALCTDCHTSLGRGWTSPPLATTDAASPWGAPEADADDAPPTVELPPVLTAPATGRTPRYAMLGRLALGVADVVAVRRDERAAYGGRPVPSSVLPRLSVRAADPAALAERADAERRATMRRRAAALAGGR